MPAPYTVVPGNAPGTGPASSVDGSGNETTAGTHTVSQGVVLLPYTPPFPAPPGLFLYSPDGKSIATLGANGAAAGLPPTGTAGGDLSGTYPNPTVAKIKGVAVSGTPSNGQLLTSTGAAAATWQAPAADPVVQAFSYTGTLAVYTGDFRWYNDTGRTLTFGTIRASVGVAPTGASVIVDVLKGGTTIFTTTANRPTIAASTNTATNGGVPDVATIAAGEYLTISILQIGSTVAGSDLTVSVVMT